MELIKMKVKDIIPYDNNPRKNDDAVDVVAKSIKQCEYIAPIVVDENNVVLAGHTRLKALNKLGYKECEVIVKKGLTEQQKKKYRLLDNKTNEIAEWDYDILREELVGLDFEDLDLNWDVELPTDVKEVKEDYFNVDEAIPEEPITKRGDIYQLGNHRLMCGSSTSKEDIEKLMDGQLADMCLTDPPYNVNYRSINESGYGKKRLSGKKILNDNQSDSNFRQFLFDFYTNMNNLLKCGGVFYIFHADSEGVNFRGGLRDAGLKDRETLIWVKNALVLGRQDYQWQHEPCLYGWKEGAGHYFINDRTQTTVIEDKIDVNKLKKDELLSLVKELMSGTTPTTIIHEDKPLVNDLHPTMKPLKLCGRLIQNSSLVNDIVFDGFGGSGSTLMACEQTNRICYTMELDERYVDVIVKRWEEFTGKKAVKLEV